MIQLDPIKLKLKELDKASDEIYVALNIDTVKNEHKELSMEMSAPDSGMMLITPRGSISALSNWKQDKLYRQHKEPYRGQLCNGGDVRR